MAVASARARPGLSELLCAFRDDDGSESSEVSEFDDAGNLNA
jgi:hypothetical protein